MQELIENITSQTGLQADKAEKAVGILLNLLATQGDKAKLPALFDAMPGAAELARSHGTDGASGGGLMGMLAGGMMGGPLAMITKLQALGLSVDQIKTVASLSLAHAREKAGADVLRAAAGNIPGLATYL